MHDTSSITLSDQEFKALERKRLKHLLIILALGYMFCNIDRINIGFAKLQMLQDTGISEVQYGIGASIFFIGYLLFEIPSNLLFPKIGARRTFSRIMVLWGLATIGLMWVQSHYSFYGLRFLLGVFEAGFAPGMFFYLTYWYSQQHMAKVMALLLASAPIGSVISSPISGYILSRLNEVGGLKGWQWLFLLEGIPTVLIGILLYKCLVDRPEQASWLNAKEKQWLLNHSAIHNKNTGAQAHQHRDFVQVLKDYKIYLMSFAYFSVITGLYMVNFWLPTLIAKAGVTDTRQIGWLTALPYLAGAIAMYVAAKSSDHFAERKWHSSLMLLAGAVCLGVAAYSQGIVMVMLFMTLATALMFGAYVVFWAMPSAYISGTQAAGAMALINTLGLTGGLVSPNLMAWAVEFSGSEKIGLLIMSGLMLLGAVVQIFNQVQPKGPCSDRQLRHGQ
ncbi:MFS transporter [Brackiella oedipodis]|uniref:MFS transporter n=1 Tax=Brackiella oedipodis TaxID=124225 RepID=UPI000685FAED|nr:MFS transporter [Brackiella oedipodis]